MMPRNSGRIEPPQRRSIQSKNQLTEEVAMVEQTARAVVNESAQLAATLAARHPSAICPIHSPLLLK